MHHRRSEEQRHEENNCERHSKLLEKENARLLWEIREVKLQAVYVDSNISGGRCVCVCVCVWLVMWSVCVCVGGEGGGLEKVVLLILQPFT